MCMWKICTIGDEYSFMVDGCSKTPSVHYCHPLWMNGAVKKGQVLPCKCPPKLNKEHDSD